MSDKLGKFPNDNADSSAATNSSAKSNSSGKLDRIIYSLNKKSYFKYISSVRLAIPLMLILLLVLAAGTIVESLYHANLARLFVYDTGWFIALLVLLWVNIFCSTISRYPFKKKHVGFIVVHIGLLTLLVGAVVTKTLGIDGQLQVQQGSESNEVILQDLVLMVFDPKQEKPNIIPVSRLSGLSQRSLKSVSKSLASNLTVMEFLPFSKKERQLEKISVDTSGVGQSKTQTSTLTSSVVQFELKSPFFSTEQTLQWPPSSLAPDSLSMGPARFELKLIGSRGSELPASLHETLLHETLVVSLPGKTLRIDVQELKKRKKLQLENDFTLSLLESFKNAVVDKTGLKEDRSKKGLVNPALVIEVEKEGQRYRDIAFARFPDFKLVPDNKLNVSFRYESSLLNSVNSNNSSDGTRAVFEVSENSFTSRSVMVRFFKRGKYLTSIHLKEGEDGVSLPWMKEGFMKIKLTKLAINQQLSEKVVATPLRKGQDLPPAAIHLRWGQGSAEQNAWLSQGESRQIGGVEVYFGLNFIQLPFMVHLDKFSKVDYVGTDKPKSFESDVTVLSAVRKKSKPDDSNVTAKIFMNNPLYHEGFTIYQAAYDLKPGMPATSIFSVNADPGRWMKYIGSIILVLGIIIFTLQRSSLFQRSRFSKG